MSRGQGRHTRRGRVRWHAFDATTRGHSMLRQQAGHRRHRTRLHAVLVAVQLVVGLPHAHGAGGEIYATATPIVSLPFNDTGNTTGHVNDRDTIAAFCSTYVDTSGPDLVYTLELGVGNSLNITVDPAPGYDTSIYLYKGCGTGEQCTAGADNGQSNDPEAFSVSNLAPGTYYLWVDAFYANDAGSYTLSVTGVLGSTTTTSSTTTSSSTSSPTSTSSTSSSSSSMAPLTTSTSSTS